MGGTELRIVLVALNLLVLRWPGMALGAFSIRVFDLAGVAAAIVLGVIGISLMVRNTLTLYRAEPLPRASDAAEALAADTAEHTGVALVVAQGGEGRVDASEDHEWISFGAAPVELRKGGVPVAEEKLH
jgi:hypothetical protein